MRNIITFTNKRLGEITAALLLGSVVCQGTTVNFGDASHAPGDTLQMGAVTISGSPAWGPGGQPATLAGTGLGSAIIGPADSIDRQMHFSANGFSADSNLMEGLSLSVNGHINSITFTPQFFVSGLGESVQLPFQVMIYPLALAPDATFTGPMRPDWITVNPANGCSVTYRGVFASGQFSSFYIGLTSANNPNASFYPYLQSHNFPDTTFQFGVRLDSINYTSPGLSPVFVPEPSSFSLFGLGLIGLGWRRWQGKKS